MDFLGEFLPAIAVNYSERLLLMQWDVISQSMPVKANLEVARYLTKYSEIKTMTGLKVAE